MNTKINLGLISAAILLSFSAQAAVTITIEQENSSQVRIRWNGTLDVRAADTVDNNRLDTGQSAFFSATDNFSFVPEAGKGYYLNEFGTTTPINDPDGFIVFELGTNSQYSFGYAANDLAYNDIHISGGTSNAVTELTFVGSRDTFLLKGTLATLKATNYNNNVVYTSKAASGDTISITTSSSVPEPSSAILVALGALSAFLRRKR